MSFDMADHRTEGVKMRVELPKSEAHADRQKLWYLTAAGEEAMVQAGPGQRRRNARDVLQQGEGAVAAVVGVGGVVERRSIARCECF